MRRQLIEKSIVRTVMSDTPCENWTFPRRISRRLLHGAFSFPQLRASSKKCESCARVNTIHLNPIILADYWLDSVCSLCRWSRLTLSLPCLVRLHIYIINYITLLIIIFTPSRSHATPHRNPDADARDTRHYAPRIVSCRMRDCTKAKKRKEMENASEENRPDLCFFFRSRRYPSRRARQTCTRTKRTLQPNGNLSHTIVTSEIYVFKPKKWKEEKISSFFLGFLFFLFRFIFFKFYSYGFFFSLFFSFRQNSQKSRASSFFPSRHVLFSWNIRHITYSD